MGLLLGSSPGMRAIIRSPAEVANPLLFFFMVITLFPLGLGPDPQRLAEMAPGILWVVALLSSLMVSGKSYSRRTSRTAASSSSLSRRSLSGAGSGRGLRLLVGDGFLLALASPIFALMLGLPATGIFTLMVSLLLGTTCLTLIGAVGSALTVSIRRGGMLLSLLIIPLNVPVLIFGTTAVSEAVVGGNATSWLALMGALALGSLAVMPVAIGAALRVSLDQ